MVETIRAAAVPIAIVVRAGDRGHGTEFVTAPEAPMQLGLLTHPRGYKVAPHVHQDVARVTKTCEALVVRSGRIRADLFDEHGRPCGSRELAGGDVILFLAGGHGVEVLEDVDMIEIKTGPFAGELDKVLLKGATKGAP